MKYKSRPLRILDWDIENRPLSYWQPDRPTAEITSIAWSWADEDLVEVRALGEYSTDRILGDFLDAYNRADMVTGHYITKHDLPITNAMLIEENMPTLSPKLAHDTKTHMIKKADLPATQEHLCQMLGIPATKYHMTQAMWREANRLTPEGIALTKKRVVDDVIQHKLLRLEMIKRNLLHAPRTWSP